MTTLKDQKSDRHTPVLMREILALISPKFGESYLDLTAGRGGHASAVLDVTQNYNQSTLVDRDNDAITYLQDHFGSQIELIHDNFWLASNKLLDEGQKFDLILADLGVSSPQFDNPDRGFSFSNPGPLDMRMDQNQEQSAYQIINSEDESIIERMIKLYGEEPKAKRIAHAIVSNRPIQTTDQLSTVITTALGQFQGKKTLPRVFQAFRIAVNDELNLLSKALPIWCQLLKPGGRLAVISFHSLEDRIVKDYFRSVAGGHLDSKFILLNKKPITATSEELAINPRSRSAKLRVVVKK